MTGHEFVERVRRDLVVGEFFDGWRYKNESGKVSTLLPALYPLNGGSWCLSHKLARNSGGAEVVALRLHVGAMETPAATEEQWRFLFDLSPLEMLAALGRANPDVRLTDDGAQIEIPFEGYDTLYDVLRILAPFAVRQRV
jgi:hypothetical protein